MDASNSLPSTAGARVPVPFWRVGAGERELAHELMDDPSLDPARHEAALEGLATINRVSRTVARLTPPLVAPGARLGRPIRVLDIATGAGDVPIGLHRSLRAKGVDCEVAGCDVSAGAVDVARERAERRGVPAKFFRANALEDLLAGWDAVTCCLFLHHLTTEQAEELLAKLARSARLVLVSDLERSALGLAAAAVGTRLLTRSEVAHVDGPLSVRAAFTLTEMRALAAGSGLRGAVIRRAFPFRLLLTWSRS